MKYALALAASAALLVPAAASAQSGVFAPDPTGTLTQDHDAGNPVNLGNFFTVNKNGFVKSLGFYTPTNLVGGGEFVSLYTAAGTQLASVFVSATTGTPGQYVYAALATPIAVTAGQQYAVVNNVGQNAWAYGSVSATGATFDYNAYAYGSALAFPTQTGGASGPAYLGPNLVISGVPEPTTWAMMLVGFGAVGGAMRRRKGKVTTTVAYA